MSNATVWATLGLQPTNSPEEIRRAYARKLKVTRPDDDAEGFQRLRAAYEIALQLAADPTDSEDEDEDDEASAAIPTSRAPIEYQQPVAQAPIAAPVDTELTALQAAFRTLLSALHGREMPQAAALQSTLQEILRAPALERISVRCDFEPVLANLLASTIPRSDVLLDECVSRFGWTKHERGLTPNPAVLAVLERQRDVEVLKELRKGRTAESKAYARLCKKNHPIARWWRTVRSRTTPPELLLLSGLRDRHPRLIATLDGGEVEWWQRFATRPHVSSAMLRMGMLITAVAGLIGLAMGNVDDTALRTATLTFLSTGGAIAALIVAKLYGIDWPVLLISRRWRGRPPLWVQAGWFPIVLAVFVLACGLPRTPWILWPACLIGLTCCLWAVYISGPLRSAVQNNSIILTNSHFGRALMFNLLLAPWWLSLLQEITPDGQLDLRSLVASTAMGASAFGGTALGQVWFERLRAVQRHWLLGVLTGSALLLGILLYFDVAGPSWRALLAALVAIVIVMHRTPCVTFSAAQMRARWVAIGVLGVFAFVMLSIDVPLGEAPILRWGGILMLASTLFELGIACYNEFRQLRELKM